MLQDQGELAEAKDGVLVKHGDLTSARSLAERALAMCEQALGADHRDMVGPLSTLANVLYEQDDMVGVQSLLERIVAVLERSLGPDHPSVASWPKSSALLIEQLGDHLAAARLFWKLLIIQQRQPTNLAEGESFVNLSRMAAVLGSPENGLRLLATTLVIDRQLGIAYVEEEGMPLFRKLAEALDLDEAQLNVMLAEVGETYCQDRGRRLVAAAFPELGIEV